MQNSRVSQMKMLCSRLGVGSKCVITGDVDQVDIQGLNGLCDLRLRCRVKGGDRIEMIELSNSDIERSEIVKRVIALYDISEYELSNYRRNASLSAEISPEIPSEITKEEKEITKEEKEITKEIRKEDKDAALIPWKDESKYYSR